MWLLGLSTPGPGRSSGACHAPEAAGHGACAREREHVCVSLCAPLGGEGPWFSPGRESGPVTPCSTLRSSIVSPRSHPRDLTFGASVWGVSSAPSEAAQQDTRKSPGQVTGETERRLNKAKQSERLADSWRAAALAFPDGGHREPVFMPLLPQQRVGS